MGCARRSIRAPSAAPDAQGAAPRYTRLMKPIQLIAALSGAVLIALSSAPVHAEGEPGLDAVIDGPQRTPALKARDQYRHPYEELTFFGLKPKMAVVEIWPSPGYWTEILAPYLKGHGAYY